MQVQAQLRSFPVRSLFVWVALVLALTFGGLAGYAVRAISVAGSAAPAASTASTPPTYQDEYARHFASEHPGAVPNVGSYPYVPTAGPADQDNPGTVNATEQSPNGLTGEAARHSYDERSDFGRTG